MSKGFSSPSKPELSKDFTSNLKKYQISSSFINEYLVDKRFKNPESFTLFVGNLSKQFEENVSGNILGNLLALTNLKNEQDRNEVSKIIKSLKGVLKKINEEIAKSKAAIYSDKTQEFSSKMIDEESDNFQKFARVMGKIDELFLPYRTHDLNKLLVNIGSAAKIVAECIKTRSATNVMNYDKKDDDRVKELQAKKVSNEKIIFENLKKIDETLSTEGGKKMLASILEGDESKNFWSQLTDFASAGSLDRKSAAIITNIVSQLKLMKDKGLLSKENFYEIYLLLNGGQELLNTAISNTSKNESSELEEDTLGLIAAAEKFKLLDYVGDKGKTSLDTIVLTSIESVNYENFLPIANKCDLRKAEQIIFTLYKSSIGGSNPIIIKQWFDNLFSDQLIEKLPFTTCSENDAKFSSLHALAGALLDTHTYMEKFFAHSQNSFMQLLSQTDGEDNTPLHLSATKTCHEDRSTALFLLNKGADIKAQNKAGETAIHFAAKLKNSLNLKVLLDHETTNAQIVNLRNKKGATALHIAAGAGNIKGVIELLRHGADLSIKDSKDQTPLQIANAAGKRDVVIAIVKYYKEQLEEILKNPVDAKAIKDWMKSVNANGPHIPALSQMVDKMLNMNSEVIRNYLDELAIESTQNKEQRHAKMLEQAKSSVLSRADATYSKNPDWAENLFTAFKSYREKNYKEASQSASVIESLANLADIHVNQATNTTESLWDLRGVTQEVFLAPAANVKKIDTFKKATERSFSDEVLSYQLESKGSKREAFYSGLGINELLDQKQQSDKAFSIDDATDTGLSLDDFLNTDAGEDRGNFVADNSREIPVFRLQEFLIAAVKDEGENVKKLFEILLIANSPCSLYRVAARFGKRHYDAKLYESAIELLDERYQSQARSLIKHFELENQQRNKVSAIKTTAATKEANDLDTAKRKMRDFNYEYCEDLASKLLKDLDVLDAIKDRGFSTEQLAKRLEIILDFSSKNFFDQTKFELIKEFVIDNLKRPSALSITDHWQRNKTESKTGSSSDRSKEQTMSNYLKSFTEQRKLEQEFKEENFSLQESLPSKADVESLEVIFQDLQNIRPKNIAGSIELLKKTLEKEGSFSTAQLVEIYQDINNTIAAELKLVNPLLTKVEATEGDLRRVTTLQTSGENIQTLLKTHLKIGESLPKILNYYNFNSLISLIKEDEIVKKLGLKNSDKIQIAEIKGIINDLKAFITEKNLILFFTSQKDGEIILNKAIELFKDLQSENKSEDKDAPLGLNKSSDAYKNKIAAAAQAIIEQSVKNPTLEIDLNIAIKNLIAKSPELITEPDFSTLLEVINNDSRENNNDTNKSASNFGELIHLLIESLEDNSKLKKPARFVAFRQAIGDIITKYPSLINEVENEAGLSVIEKLTTIQINNPDPLLAKLISDIISADLKTQEKPKVAQKKMVELFSDEDLELLRSAMLAQYKLKVNHDGLVTDREGTAKISNSYQTYFLPPFSLLDAALLTESNPFSDAIAKIKSKFDSESESKDPQQHKKTQVLFSINANGNHWVLGRLTIDEKGEINLSYHDSLGTQDRLIDDSGSREKIKEIFGNIFGKEKMKEFSIANQRKIQFLSTELNGESPKGTSKADNYCGGYSTRLAVNYALSATDDLEWNCCNDNGIKLNHEQLRKRDVELVSSSQIDKENRFLIDSTNTDENKEKKEQGKILDQRNKADAEQIHLKIKLFIETNSKTLRGLDQLFLQALFPLLEAQPNGTELGKLITYLDSNLLSKQIATDLKEFLNSNNGLKFGLDNTKKTVDYLREELLKIHLRSKVKASLALKQDDSVLNKIVDDNIKIFNSGLFEDHPLGRVREIQEVYAASAIIEGENLQFLMNGFITAKNTLSETLGDYRDINTCKSMLDDIKKLQSFVAKAIINDSSNVEQLLKDTTKKLTELNGVVSSVIATITPSIRPAQEAVEAALAKDDFATAQERSDFIARTISLTLGEGPVKDASATFRRECVKIHGIHEDEKDLTRNSLSESPEAIRYSPSTSQGYSPSSFQLEDSPVYLHTIHTPGKSISSTTRAFFDEGTFSSPTSTLLGEDKDEKDSKQPSELNQASSSTNRGKTSTTHESIVKSIMICIENHNPNSQKLLDSILFKALKKSPKFAPPLLNTKIEVDINGNKKFLKLIEYASLPRVKSTGAKEINYEALASLLKLPNNAIDKEYLLALDVFLSSYEKGDSKRFQDPQYYDTVIREIDQIGGIIEKFAKTNSANGKLVDPSLRKIANSKKTIADRVDIYNNVEQERMNYENAKIALIAIGCEFISKRRAMKNVEDLSPFIKALDEQFKSSTVSKGDTILGKLYAAYNAAQTVDDVDKLIIQQQTLSKWLKDAKDPINSNKVKEGKDGKVIFSEKDATKALEAISKAEGKLLEYKEKLEALKLNKEKSSGSRRQSSVMGTPDSKKPDDIDSPAVFHTQSEISSPSSTSSRFSIRSLLSRKNSKIGSKTDEGDGR